MPGFNFCRICLDHNSTIYAITTTPLREFYEKITDQQQLITRDGKQLLLCYICYHLLKKCYRFAESASKTNDALQCLINSENELRQESVAALDKTLLFTKLTKSPTKCDVTLDLKELNEDIVDSVVKIENSEIKKETLLVKEDLEDKKEEIEETAFEEPSYSSDSEDDIPLQSISTKKSEGELQKKRNIKKVALNKRNKNVIKADAREVILTREQQIEQVLERSKSLNYLHSPHRCDLCYKGFVDVRAYENHKEKHDERSGPYECDICRMRYRTPRHLRTHTHTCHARQYACNKCSHTSHTPNQAREHEKWHNGYTYECKLCSQKFSKPTSYLTHLRKRHPTPHVCTLCGASFVGPHGLRMHQTKVHNGIQKHVEESDQKFCADCNMRFVSLDAWKRHIITSVTHAVGNDSRTTCLVCNEQVPAVSLRAHVSSHERAARGVRGARGAPEGRRLLFPCDQCTISFPNRSKLNAHTRRTHLGLKYNKNMVCEVCGKKCVSNASLTYHQRRHTGERPYACAQCDKRFIDKNQLRIHTRTHTGERPYSCVVCAKRFSQKPALNRHFRTHTGAKPYDCQFCAKTFSQSNSLKLHVNTVHFKIPHAKKKNQANEQPPQQDS